MLRGFTLIELAIVVVIAAILAAVALPIYQGMVDDAKYSEAEATVGSIATGLDTYRGRYGTYDSPAGGGAAAYDVALIDTALKVNVQNAASKGWQISATATSASYLAICVDQAGSQVGLGIGRGVQRNQLGVITRT